MNKTILITGATSGIGKSAAIRFAQAGYRLIITGRRQNLLEELVRKLQTDYKTDILSITLDVRNREKVMETIGNLPVGWEHIDILLNNAGLAAGLDPVENANLDDWEEMIDTNIKGFLYVAKAIIPGMIKRKEGHIINLGSIAGRETYPNGNVYCATKHAVDALSKSMSIDLLKYGIKVSQIAPGAVETEFSIVRFKGDKEAAKNIYKGFTPLTGDDIAETIFFVASQPKNVCIKDIVIVPLAQASVVHWHKEL